MSWRLEPTPRSPGVDEGLAARVHDPLWFLARQWQVGEFHGKDAGTPAVIQVSGESTPVNAWHGAQQTTWTPFDPAGEPLNALVEPEDEGQPDLRERIEAGAYFLRLLNAAGLSALASAFVSAHAFVAADLASPDFAADPLLAALAQRVPDGLLLNATAVALAAGNAQPVTIDPGDLPTVVTAANTWLAWYAAELPVTTGTGTAVTWQEHRMEYGFAVSSPAVGGTVLVADQYLGDGLDWFDFDIDPSATTGPDAPTTPIVAKAVPTPVRYGGMPLPRFWAMEDAQYDFGSVEAAANDIGRMLLVEFATVFGNDWHILPHQDPGGNAYHPGLRGATDVFGRNLVLNRAGQGDPNWNLFSLDTRGAAPRRKMHSLCLRRPPTWARANPWRRFFPPRPDGRLGLGGGGFGAGWIGTSGQSSLNLDRPAQATCRHARCAGLSSRNGGAGLLDSARYRVGGGSTTR